MKVEAKNKTGFEPIEISITIETREELQAIKEVFSLNCTIPEALNNTDSKKVAVKLLDSVFNLLRNK